MEKLFDFECIRGWFQKGHSITFDAMHAVTGPYAKEIFEKRLGAAAGSVINGIPLEDFGRRHPDPNLVYATDLVEIMHSDSASDLGAASDGDGDRNMILGKDFFVSPGDSLAAIAEHLTEVAPGYQDGIRGVARSMPTSMAVDRVAEALGVKCYETPTGWKYFGNLMDAGLCTLCGEESFGTGSSHIREKDGLWAVLCWLSILAKKNLSVEEVMHKHWTRFGRSYFQRYDFENLDIEKSTAMLEAFRKKLPGLKGQEVHGVRIEETCEFSYKDPVDQSVAERQGIQILMEGHKRIIIRFSGTGTQGMTLRLYLDFFEANKIDEDVDNTLKPYADAMIDLLKLEEFCQRNKPTVVT